MIRASRRLLRQRELAAGIKPVSRTGIGVAAVVAAALAWVLWTKWHHWLTAVLFVLAMSVLFSGLVWVVKRIPRRRESATICEFARSFDCRNTDTLVIRAVFERLSDWLGTAVRRDDDLFADWDMDALDFEDAVEEISTLVQRPLAGMEGNPYYGRVCTPGELVNFFMHQPRRA